MGSFVNGLRLVLAPMAGVTDPAMRVLCREAGAEMAFTEMVSAKGLSYANEKTRHLIDVAPEEDKVAVQLFGHEPDTMAAQAVWVEDALGERLSYIDINMGCPARKIVTKGDGSALMRTPEIAEAIVSSVKGRISHPLTVKFRRGWAEGDETCVEFARRMEDAGADGITVHGRFAMQMYRGRADWDAIGRVKRAVSIPVLGNGDVKGPEDALAMLGQTGCDGVMVARAAQGNPWVFARIAAAMEGREVPPEPGLEQRIAMARRHTRLLAQRDERTVVRMRKHAMWYVAGLPGAAAARRMFSTCSTVEEFDRAFDVLLETAAGHREGASA